MNYYFYPYIALTGGADGALDSLDGSLLKDGDAAFIVVPSSRRTYIFTLDEDSGATEDGVNVISPDSNAGTKRWIRTNSPIDPHDVTYYGAVEGDAEANYAGNVTAIAAAIAANPDSYITFPGGTFWGKIVIDGSSGFCINGNNAVIKGPADGTVLNAVVELKNSTAIFINDLNVKGNYNTDLVAGIWGYTDDASQLSYCNFKNVNVIGAPVAWRFGHSSYVDALVSENYIMGGYTYGCPIACQCIGSQTVINFNGQSLISGLNGGSGDYLSLARGVAITKGGYINITGGEALITDVTDAVAFHIEPIASNNYGNPYGRISVVNCVVESSSPVLSTNNNNIATPSVGLFRMMDCTGYHGFNNAHYMLTDAKFAGKVMVKDCDFYAGTARTYKNLDCSNSSCQVYIDDHSFGANFVQGLAGINNGTLHFTPRQVLRVSTLNAQVLPGSNTTTLKFQAVDNSGDLARFSGQYNNTTGLFTVPFGGLKNIEVRGQIVNHNTSATSELYVMINNSVFAAKVLAHLAQDISYRISSLNANDTIGLAVLNNGSNATTANSTLDQFDIFAGN